MLPIMVGVVFPVSGLDISETLCDLIFPIIPQTQVSKNSLTFSTTEHNFYFEQLFSAVKKIVLIRIFLIFSAELNLSSRRLS